MQHTYMQHTYMHVQYNTNVLCGLMVSSLYTQFSPYSVQVQPVQHYCRFGLRPYQYDIIVELLIVGMMQQFCVIYTCIVARLKLVISCFLQLANALLHNITPHCTITHAFSRTFRPFKGCSQYDRIGHRHGTQHTHEMTKSIVKALQVIGHGTQQVNTHMK